MRLTVVQIADRLRTEADAYRFLEALRWGDGDPVCPHCDNEGATYIRPLNGTSRKTRTGAMSERRVWRCLSCRKQFSAITGTVFHGTKVPLRTWALVIFEMCASKNGVSAREIERKYGVCPRTAWHMMHRIREAMKTDGLVQTMRANHCCGRDVHRWQPEKPPCFPAGGASPSRPDQARARQSADRQGLGALAHQHDYGRGSLSRDPGRNRRIAS
jgi:transposase-like protein